MRKVTLSLGLIGAAFVVVATLLMADKGYFADDWSNISQSFWRPLGAALVEYAVVMRRPTAGFYFIGAVKLANYDPQIVFALSQLTYLAAHVLMAFALAWALPRQRALVTATVLMSFVMPATLGGTYWHNADNMRFAALMYWLSVLGFQYWALHPRRWSLPLLPVIAFTFALLSYESVVAMPFVTVLLALPLYWRYHADKGWAAHAWAAAQIVAAHGVAYTLFMYVRAVYRIESHVTAAEQGALLSLVWDYVRYVGLWLASGVQILWHAADPVSWIVGLVVGGTVGWVVFAQHDALASDAPVSPYVWLLALGWFGAGVLPFVVFNQAPGTLSAVGGKGYTLAGTGAALLFALILYAMARRGGMVWFAALLGVWTGMFAGAHVAARIPYEAAQATRQTLLHSLLEVVPDIQDETVILLLNHQLSVNDGPLSVPVFGEAQANYLVQMLYHNRTITAAAVVDYDTGFNAVVSADGLYVPGATVPLDAVVIVERVGDSYRLVDTLTSDAPYVIHWQDGITALYTNPDRVLSAPNEPTRFQRLFLSSDAEG